MQNGILAILAAAAVLTGCGRGGPEEEGRLKIGYIVNFMSHEWYQNICSAAEARAAELGVDLVIADANLDIAAQISKAENMIAQGVDVLALTPVDAKALGVVIEQARAKGIRVLTESNPAVGAETYVGIDNRGGRPQGGGLVRRARSPQPGSTRKSSSSAIRTSRTAGSASTGSSPPSTRPDSPARWSRKSTAMASRRRRSRSPRTP